MASKYQKLLNKHVVVIGGTSGIGFGVAEASLASGAQVTVSSSNQSRVDAAVEKLKGDFPDGKVTGYTCDLSKPTVEQDLEDLFSKVGKADHIVYSAGDKLAAAPVQEITYEKIISAGHVRFVAPLLAAKVGSKYLNPGPYSSIILTTGSESKKKHFEVVTVQLPTGRIAQPVDVAEAYLFLMKDPSVTGTVVDSNSGAFLI
ncbi:hypothetical protein KVR01_001916 [Diaporthe batatas]|uniref:uncharacterized protein n=1 Tax=Diaporthe batatas TaxID=748121 RepID=UPI001D0488A4|nr:uncharacterized protein KVR01_001916 [Diaporthe batatas]KAG8169167.1 hypothetical protein KVR01_001916 [Diaporthe batatas]